MPDYPELARQLNVTGKVKVEATVAARRPCDGRRKVLGGSPVLVELRSRGPEEMAF